MSRTVFSDCDICEEEIYIGEKYYSYNVCSLLPDRLKVCEECAKKMTGEEMLVELGFDYIEAEEDYDECNRREL